MSRGRLLLPAIIASTLLLTGCVSDSAAEREQAYEECRSKITPQFDEPDTVSWPDEGWGYSGSGDSRQIVAVVDDGGERTRVDCWLAATDEGWELSRYEFSEPKDEVVN